MSLCIHTHTQDFAPRFKCLRYQQRRFRAQFCAVLGAAQFFARGASNTADVTAVLLDIALAGYLDRVAEARFDAVSRLFGAWLVDVRAAEEDSELEEGTQAWEAHLALAASQRFLEATQPR